MFIDGLDEFEGSSDIVLNLIGKLANQTNVKICVSSRPLLVFEKAFSGKPSLKLQDLTFGTILKYAVLKLSEPIQERVSLDNANTHKVEDLLDKIVRRADGVFIWAVIAIKDIREGLREMADMKELEQMIESLPSELEKLFMRMLDHIKPVYKRDAVRFLQLVLHSDVPLSLFREDLCTLYFSQSQRESIGTPFVYKAIATSELVVACRTLKTRLQSHTAGLLELTSQDVGARIYDKMPDLDQILFTQVNFVHRTVRDFLFNNAEARSLLIRMGSTEAQVRLSIAKGILAQIAHFSQGHAKFVDRQWRNPMYEPFVASLLQISLSERLLGVAQTRLMRSLDFACFARGYLVVGSPRYGSSEAYHIDGKIRSSIDLVGMAAAVGMTLYVCEQLDLTFDSRHFYPRFDPDNYARNRHEAATLCWIGGKESAHPISMLATGLDSLDYRQTLARCLQWKTDDPLSLRTVTPMGVAPLAETYMLSCCMPRSLDLIHILLRAGASPMAEVECLANEMPTVCFWLWWLQFLVRLRIKYVEANGTNDGILLESDDFDAEITSKEVFDTTKALLFNGADIDFKREPWDSYNIYRRIPHGEQFYISFRGSYFFLLEKCFSTEPDFREFAVAMEPLVTKPRREIVKISDSDQDLEVSGVSIYTPSSEECDLLWPLIEKWESTGHREDLDSLQTALEAVWKAHGGRHKKKKQR
ncbi:MAG: hypothetical protein Q9206_002071 [Seirophora lacunosa]